MLIINADDWGRSRSETDAALACFRQGRITSVTAMMFMQDSERAAQLAGECGVDVGLHLNLNQPYDAAISPKTKVAHECLVRFMNRGKLTQFVYHPLLRQQFKDVYKSQYEEFLRRYGRAPSHIDGHQHRHLCANMLVDRIIRPGERVRRSFSYWPGEKNCLNRAYRRVLDRWLSRWYRVADFFFSLGECLAYHRLQRVQRLARQANVELMTHPVHAKEFDFLMGSHYAEIFADADKGTYSRLG
jgi:chitin disaccharide deacetylase